VIDAIRLGTESVMSLLRKDPFSSDEEDSDEESYLVRSKSVISSIAFY